MSPIFELEEEVQTRHEAPRLLVQWSSRWEEFIGSVKPALSRSEARLAGEAPFGLVPFRIMIPSYVIEAFVILAAIFIKVKVDELRPYVVPRIASHDVIYYSGDELPRTEDLGGAESGRTGEAGGQEAHHRTQTIKVARGESLVPQVVDAPNLKLPASTNAVANLLAIKPDPGPPPAEGMRSTRSTPNLVATLVAPSPNVIHDYTRNGIRLDPVAAPSTSVTRDRPLTAPSFSPTLVAPAPSVSGNHTLVAPALAPAVAPPPTVSRDHPLAAPTLDPAVAPPVANLKRDPFRAAPSFGANVAAPAPSSVSRQLSAAPVQSMDPRVVPPPVSAPEQASARTPKMSLPAPAVAAPPPSTDIGSDVRRLSSGTVPDPGKAVVPPPSPQASGSLMGSLLGRILGPSQVAPPPPTSVSGNSTNSGSRPALTPNVAPPPTPLGAADPGGNVRGNRNGSGVALGSSVVAPPPSTGLSGGTGTARPAAPYIGNASVVAPPPSLAGNGGGSGKLGGGAGAPGGRLLADNVAPPPPSLAEGKGGATVSGLSRKGPGLGAPLDPGSGPAPPTSAGSGKEAGTVMSTQPGTKIGLPPNASKGSLAMSPVGGEKPGLGGAGGGNSIGHGTGTGSGMSGTDSGAGHTGTGHGSDPNSHGGISPANGPGGAGNIPAGSSAVPGVSISGGSTSNIITLPSFGSDPSSTEPSAPDRSSTKSNKPTLGFDIVGGSPFEAYKKLLGGETHYTVVDTIVGAVSMYYSDPTKTGQGFRGALAAPSALQSDLPEGLPRARMVVACTLDAQGNIKNPRVLEAGPAQMTAKVLAALRSWKFQPAMRNNQPVEVTAILGFGIDTNDHF